jgi:hypothetical protein
VQRGLGLYTLLCMLVSVCFHNLVTYAQLDPSGYTVTKQMCSWRLLRFARFCLSKTPFDEIREEKC